MKVIQIVIFSYNVRLLFNIAITVLQSVTDITLIIVLHAFMHSRESGAGEFPLKSMRLSCNKEKENVVTLDNVLLRRWLKSIKFLFNPIP